MQTELYNHCIGLRWNFKYCLCFYWYRNYTRSMNKLSNMAWYCHVLCCSYCLSACYRWKYSQNNTNRNYIKRNDKFKTYKTNSCDNKATKYLCKKKREIKKNILDFLSNSTNFNLSYWPLWKKRLYSYMTNRYFVRTLTYMIV